MGSCVPGSALRRLAVSSYVSQPGSCSSSIGTWKALGFFRPKTPVPAPALRRRGPKNARKARARARAGLCDTERKKRRDFAPRVAKYHQDKGYGFLGSVLGSLLFSVFAASPECSWWHSRAQNASTVTTSSS